MIEEGTAYFLSRPRRFALHKALKANGFNQIREIFFSLCASIPNDWYRRNDLDRFEGYYASVFYAAFASPGLEIVPEDVSNHGRLDMTILFNGQVCLFEFKIVEKAGKENTPLGQIREKAYADRYRALNRPIRMIGIEFSRKARNVAGFAWENAAGEGGAR